MNETRIEIKGIDDRLTVAKILIANGYTVRQVGIKGQGQRATTFIEFWKGDKEQ